MNRLIASSGFNAALATKCKTRAILADRTIVVIGMESLALFAELFGAETDPNEEANSAMISIINVINVESSMCREEI